MEASSTHDGAYSTRKHDGSRKPPSALQQGRRKLTLSFRPSMERFAQSLPSATSDEESADHVGASFDSKNLLHACNSLPVVVVVLSRDVRT